MDYYRLKENHPFLKKVRKLEEFADKLGISITCNYQQQMLIIDTKKDIIYQYRDIEQGMGSYDATTSFPYFTETKLIFEKE